MSLLTRSENIVLKMDFIKVNKSNEPATVIPILAAGLGTDSFTKTKNTKC
jgi:hypothetical protein